MSEDYKENLLKYFVGDLDQEVGENVPQFNQEVETINKNINDDIIDKLSSTQNASTVTPLGRIYSEQYSGYLIYGFYTDTSSNNYGFIYLIDDELNELQMITTFVSGTKLFPLTALKQDENGNIYGLSYTVGADTPTSRVLLFNNIFASGLKTGVYSAVLRNDYVVPNNYVQIPYSQNRIIKSPDSATYYIVLRDGSNTRFIKFVINVGSSNEWTTATLTGKFFTSRFDMFLDKTGDDEVLHFYGIDNSSPSVYYEYEIKNTTVTQKKSITLENLSTWVDTQVFVKDINNIYLYTDYNSSNYSKIYKVNGNSLITIKTISLIESSSYSFGVLFELNGGMFFFEKHPLGNSEYKAILTYIDENNNFYDYEVANYTGESPVTNLYRYVDIYYSKTYNLCKIFVPVYSTPHNTIKLAFDFNELNYNGVRYSNVNMFKPVKSVLTDEYDKMLFARNLYNRTINGNTTVSTLNIPNTNLNNIQIPQQILIGTTNCNLQYGTDVIMKNIYEELNINFSNTIYMTNENNPQNIIYNQDGANRVNDSSSNTNDYQYAKVSKVRINMGRDESVFNVTFYPLKNYYYTFFGVYVAEEIDSIEFISEDESTVYNTITGDFEIGKIYTIKQCVTIDEPIPTDNLLYNSEQVLYNNKEVYV